MARMKLLVVLGEGGHTAELLNLIDLLGNRYDYHYIISQEDNLSAARIRHPGHIYRLPRPRGKNTGALSSFLITLSCSIKAFGILQRLRPKAILSTGPAIVVPAALVGKLFKTKIIFIETGSRIMTLSMTGRIMYHIADLFFVQWPQLAKKLPRAIFAGRLI
ncbi:MAG: hypothetical protein JRH15_19715 [Deltaproteobacteria bacterium]|nr:hypothetical protein [Deltaproteobacteria bacterium]